MKSEDYLELPELIETDIMVTLPPNARAIYKQMENALLLDFQAGRVTAANTGVASMKARQIAGGWVYGEDGTAHHVHDAKLDALEDLIEELSGQPTLVAYEFQHELEAIRKKFPEAPYIGGTKGAVSNKDLPELISKWCRGEIPVLLANPASLAHGVDGLQGAGRAVIWYTPTWNLEYREQYIRRIWRQGQKERVFVYNLFAEDTVDLVVRDAIALKDKTQNGLMNALKRYWETS
jgi:SNF2 family DNA or RNA helicase